MIIAYRVLLKLGSSGEQILRQKRMFVVALTPWKCAKPRLFLITMFVYMTQFRYRQKLVLILLWKVFLVVGYSQTVLLIVIFNDF